MDEHFRVKNVWVDATRGYGHHFEFTTPPWTKNGIYMERVQVWGTSQFAIGLAKKAEDMFREADKWIAQ